MRYTYEFKKECVEMYRQGLYPETPSGIKKENFHTTIRRWARAETACSSEVLKHKKHSKKWTPEERYELVAEVITGKSNLEVAVNNGIEPSQLRKWVKKYKELGYNGLVSLKRGRPAKELNMSKTINPKLLNESEREELIRLRAENEYIKTEIEVIKKEIALREEKQAALLKAKKQQSSNKCEKPDIS